MCHIEPFYTFILINAWEMGKLDVHSVLYATRYPKQRTLQNAVAFLSEL